MKTYAVPVNRTSCSSRVSIEQTLIDALQHGDRLPASYAVGYVVGSRIVEVVESLLRETALLHPLSGNPPEITVEIRGEGYALDLGADLSAEVREYARTINQVQAPFRHPAIQIAENATLRNDDDPA